MRHRVEREAFRALQRMQIFMLRRRFSASGNRAMELSSSVALSDMRSPQTERGDMNFLDEGYWRRGWDFPGRAFSPPHFEPKRPRRDNRSRACRVWTLQTPWRQKISPLCHPGSGGSSSSFWFISLGPGVHIDGKSTGDRSGFNRRSMAYRLEGDGRSMGRRL